MWRRNMLEIYLVDEYGERGLHIMEGDGMNLFPEDEAEDYWYWYMDDLKERICNVDGGQWDTDYIIPEKYTDIHDAIPELSWIFDIDLTTWREASPLDMDKCKGAFDYYGGKPQ